MGRSGEYVHGDSANSGGAVCTAVNGGERYFRSLIENASDVITVANEQGIIRYVNRPVERILGYAPSDLRGRSVFDLVHADDRPRVVEAFVRGTQTPGHVETLEFRYRHKDGSWRVLEATGTTLLHDPAVEGVVINARDVTERKRTEERIRLLSTAVEQSSEGLAVSDLQGNLIFTNRAFAEMHGYAPEEIIGKHLSILHAPEQMPFVLEANRLLRKNGSFSGEVWHVRRDGSLFPGLMHNSVLHDDVGTPIGMIGMLRDITEIRRMQEELRRRLALEELVTTISTHFIHVAAEHVDGEILRAMQSLGESVDVDRCHLCLFSTDGKRVNDLYEWCAEGVEPHGDALRRLSLDSYPWFAERLRNGETIRVAQMADLPPQASAERETWQSVGIRSLIAIPLVVGKSIIGFLGLNSERTRKAWLEEDVRILKLVSDIFASALARKRADEGLRESEARYRAVVEAQTELICRSLPDCTLTFVNEAYCRYFGKSREELIGRSFLSLIPEQDHDAVLKHFASTWHENPVRTHEHRVIRPDGEIRWNQWTNRAILDEQGRPVEFQAVGRDVTDRKRAEEALRESEEKYRNIFDNAQVGIFRTRISDGKILESNDRHAQMYGYQNREEFIAEFVTSEHFVDPGARERMLASFKDGELRNFEARLTRKDGSIIWVLLSARIYPEKGYLEGVVTDISERKQAEEARWVFARGIEQSSEGIGITDAEDRITFVNRAVEELLGYSANELLSRRWDEAFGIEPSTLEEIRTALQRHRNWSGLVEVRDRQGHSVAAELTTLLISDEQGTPIATFSILRDARQTRRLESLQQMTEVVAGAETTDERSIHRVMSHLPELVGLDYWAIYAHHTERDILELRFCGEASRELAEAIPSLPVVGTLQGEVLRTGEIVFSPDVQNDHRFTRSAAFRKALPIVQRMNMKATCILPIRSGGRILGTLNVSARRVRTFSPEELAILKTLASQIGLLLSYQNRGPADHPKPPRLPPVDVVPIVAESETMKMVLQTARRLAATDMPIVILGPTGAGKGHLAKYIHSISPRSSGPFLTVNCACLDGELILSELFGHERGAFTGAVRQQKGCFELANGGTLLLDEVVELPQSGQAKLLQLVETQQFRRLGGEQTITTDVRVICTTNADIRECVRTGKLRQDLYYRLSAGEVFIPPLSERVEDIEPLARAYLRTRALSTGEPLRMLTDSALVRLREYHWPGNVRELQNVLALAAAHGGHVIGAKDLRFAPAGRETAEPVPQREGRSEREIILEALRRNRWNRTLTAEELGMHRNTLRHRMQKYHILE